jgi:hypothetical protein
MTSRLQDLEVDIRTTKQHLESVAERVGALQKTAAMEQTQIEQLKARRHALLLECRLENIHLPLSSGSAAEIHRILEHSDAIEQPDSEQQEQDSMDVEDSQAANSQELSLVYQREEKLQFDFTSLPDDKKVGV